MRRKSWIGIAMAAVALVGSAGLHGAQSDEQEVTRPVEAAPVAGVPREVEVAPTGTPFVVRARDVEFFQRLLQARQTRIDNKPLAKQMLIDPVTSPVRTTRDGIGGEPRAAVGDGTGVRRTVRIDSAESVNTSRTFRFRAVRSAETAETGTEAQPRTREQRTAAVETYRRSLTSGKPRVRQREEESDN